MPSGLAYAGLAGLPPIVGLYASAVAGLAYGIAGSIRQAQLGPTSTSSILTAAAIAPMAHEDVARATGLAAILALEVATILVLAWALRLGFVADLLSRPVLVGFTAAISLVIIAAQLPNLLGLTGVTTRTFQTTLDGLGGRLGQIDLDSLAIGIGVLVALLRCAGCGRDGLASCSSSARRRCSSRCSVSMTPSAWWATCRAVCPSRRSPPSPTRTSSGSCPRRRASR